jgi:HSP20 family protein
MDRLSEAFDTGATPTLPAGVFPLIKLTEDQDGYCVKAEIPGVKSDALEIHASAKSLSISGERVIEAEGNEIKYHRKEREAGKFSRMISLPDDVDAGKIDANLKDGILTISLPKAEAVRPRQITVK